MAIEITQKMVANKPSFSEIKEELITFIGDSIILGWNLSFDLAFLEISKIILPKKKRNFTLREIAKELGIKVKKCHRALPDAKILKEVFLSRLKKGTNK